jgi:hypothetical protein
MKAKITSRAISALQKIITGNTVDSIGKALSPYRSGPDLVAFFNEFGANESYSFGGGFPSRWAYVEEHLSKLNDTDRLPSVLEAAADPAHYLGTDFPVSAAVEHLNQYLAFDDLELVAAGKKYRLRNRGEPLVAVETKLAPEQHASHEFIGEQIEKCDRKLRDEDYDGAITNARSALEAVLTDIESRLDPAPPAYDGDLAKLYKRVQKHLNLDPDRPDIGDSLRQLLRGLVNIVGGLAPLRNKMGDAHARSYKPARHHAKLAVNSAKTFLDFVYDTFEYQKASGRIQEVVVTKAPTG